MDPSRSPDPLVQGPAELASHSLPTSVRNARDEPAPFTAVLPDPTPLEAAERRRTILRERLALAEVERENAELEAAIEVASARSASEAFPTRMRLDSVESTPVVLGTSHSTRSRKADKLPMYKGKSIREHQTWIRKAEVTFRLSPNEFPTDTERVLFGMMSLEGEPDEAWHNHTKGVDIGEYTWEEFAQYLLDLVEDPANRLLSAAQLYADAHQMPHQTAQAFAAYLDTIEAQLPPYSEAHRITHLLTKLKPEIRQTLMTFQELPGTREGIVHLASRLENSQKLAAKSSQSKSSGSSPRSGKRPSNSDDNPPAKHARSRYNTGYSREKRNDWKSSSSTECFNCGKKGHVSADCWSKKKTAKKDESPNKTPIGEVGDKSSKKWIPGARVQRNRVASGT